MPIWLRTFTFSKIKDYYEEENRQAKQAQGKSSGGKSITTDGKVTSPEFLKNAQAPPPSSSPNYTTRASRK
tara:strand:- start:1426 stop:1638 length:213 start_codon:yes stop_codon:yes gene_type:complete